MIASLGTILGRLQQGSAVKRSDLEQRKGRGAISRPFHF
jgi:hypothetical protein